MVTKFLTQQPIFHRNFDFFSSRPIDNADTGCRIRIQSGDESVA